VNGEGGVGERFSISIFSAFVLQGWLSLLRDGVLISGVFGVGCLFEII
jgi:hypothetical protein